VCLSATLDDPSACVTPGACALDGDAAPGAPHLCDPSVPDAKRLARYQQNVASMLVGPSALYWTSSETTGSRILSMPLTGGPQVELVADRLIPSAIAIDASYIYFSAMLSQGSTISKTRLDGKGDVETVATSSNAIGVAVDAQRIYWADSDDADLISAPLDMPKSRTTLVSDTVMARMISDDTHLYWIAGNVLGRVAKTGGEPQTLATVDAGLADLAVDATHVYFTSPGGGATESIGRVPKDGSGKVETLLTDQHQPQRIIVDDDAFYWTARERPDDGTGAVRKRLKSGGAVIPLEEHVSVPQALAVDAACVYWADVDGSVMTARKSTP
jgi:hypothetical protein